MQLWPGKLLVLYFIAGALTIKKQDLVQRLELTSMHVGGSFSNVSEGRGLERTFIFAMIGVDVYEFGALLWLSVAVLPQAVEFVVQDLIDGRCPPPVCDIGQADVVEYAIGKERPQMAVGAFCLADEKPESQDSGLTTDDSS